jgi:hypothetical protein
MTSSTAGAPKSTHDSRQPSFVASLCLATIVCRSRRTMTLWDYVGVRRSHGKPRLRRSFALPAPGLSRLNQPCDTSD